MEFIKNFPLFTIILSLFSGALCMLFKRKMSRIYTIVVECILIVMAAAVLWYTYKTGSSFTYVMGEFPAPWGNEIRAGVLEAMLALLFLIVMLCSVLAGWEYLRIDVDETKINLYYSLINLMTSALMAMTWTNDIFTGYVFLEILTLTSCGIMIIREIGRTTLAAIRYMIMNLVGSGLFLLSVVLLYDITGNLLMVPMHRILVHQASDPRNFMVISIAVGIMTIGLGLKSGLFPFHMWMPDTYGWATPTSASVLSAIVSKCYIFLLIKVYWRVVGVDLIEMLPIRYVLLFLGMCGIVFGSVSALHANNINRMVAFSSCAQIGYIYMGIGMGGMAGYLAAIFHIFAHAVTKSQLFLTTPRLSDVSGNSLLFKRLQGSGLRDKSAGIFFSAGALSMIGIPIFAGFASKLQFGVAAFENGRTSITISVLLVLAVSSLLNALYFIRTLIRIFNSADNGIPEMNPGPENEVHDEGGRKLRFDYNISMLILTVLNVLLGLFMWVFLDLIELGFGMFG